MTNREFYAAISTNENVAEELRQFAADAIEKMDKSAEARKAKPSKTAEENAVLAAKVLPMLGKMPVTAAMVAEEMGLTSNKASVLLRMLVADGKAVACEVKGAKGKVKGYTLADEE